MDVIEQAKSYILNVKSYILNYDELDVSSRHLC